MMKRETIAAVVGILAAVTVASSAKAQQNRYCGPRDQVVNRLAQGYGETRQSMGLGANNAVVEMFASQESGTWTITVTTPNGTTCLMASGKSFETLVETLPALGSDT